MGGPLPKTLPAASLNLWPQTGTYGPSRVPGPGADGSCFRISPGSSGDAAPPKGIIRIIRDFFPICLKDRFPKIWVWMKELSIFDLRFGFHIKNYPYSQSSRSNIEHPGQNMRKCLEVVRWRYRLRTKKMIKLRKGNGFVRFSM